MERSLVADTGGLLRALACDPTGAPSWPDYAAALQKAKAVIIPSLVLAEVDYFLRNHRKAMRKLIAEIVEPATTYEYEVVTPSDLVRALQIDAKFEKLRLGLVDGLVAAIAERRCIYRILTIDRRDFGVIRIGHKFTTPLIPIP